MTITLGWWTFPAIVTLVFLIWAFWPKYHSHMWGDIEVLFGFIIGLLCVAISWAVAGVFFK